jgi:pimeloyl-ACP methyl ester carboxylesterase
MVGHSWGGWAGAVVALTPKPFAPAEGSCDATAGSLRPDAFLGIDGIYSALREASDEQLLAPAVYANETTRAAGLAACDPSALAKKYAAGGGSIPIRLLQSARDGDVPLDVPFALDAVLAANGYGSTLRLVPGADHVGVMTAPEAIAAILALAKGQ